MKTIASLTLCTAVLLTTGCAQVEQRMAKYDQSTVYLKTDLYAAKRITVPGELDSSNIADFYPVPTIENQGDPKVPSFAPPAESKPSTKSITT